MPSFYCLLLLVCMTILFSDGASSLPLKKESRKELDLEENIKTEMQHKFTSHSFEKMKSWEEFGILQKLMNRNKRWLTVTTTRPPPEFVFKPWLFAF